jgi:endonuclease-3 related protein
VKNALDINSLYCCLSTFYGPSNWWPGETPFEIIVGAVLTQNTAWTNVEHAICNLKLSKLLDFETMAAAQDDLICSLIRPAGYYNIKTKRLRNLFEAIKAIGGIELFFSLDTSTMRDLLLDVNGIGEETADSICCYAAGKRSFVVDAYTKRILSRHKIAAEKASYCEVQDIFVNGLPNDLQVYKDMHAYIVFIGKDFCRKKSPRCEECPVGSSWGKPA